MGKGGGEEKSSETSTFSDELGGERKKEAAKATSLKICEQRKEGACGCQEASYQPEKYRTEKKKGPGSSGSLTPSPGPWGEGGKRGSASLSV